MVESDGRKFDTDEIIAVLDEEYVVTAVSYRDGEDNQHVDFKYQIELKSDIDTRKAEEAARQKAAEEQQ